MLRRIHDSDRGASLVEYAAVIVLVAAVAASLFMVGLPRLITDSIGDAVSDALGAGDSASEDAPGEEPGSSGTPNEEPGEEPGEVGPTDQGSEDSDQSETNGESGGPGDPVDVDPAPYLPDEGEGTMSAAPWSGGDDFVVSEAWSIEEEWDRIQNEPWFTFEDNGNYDW